MADAASEAAAQAAWPRPLDGDVLAAAWADAWQALGRPAPQGLRESLQAAWAGPQRHYHDTSHLGECLVWLQRWAVQAERPAEVALALWFHDAVYDPRAADNEALSAAWAQRALAQAGVDGDAVRRIAGLILATRHDAPAEESRDAALLLDIDLAILGSPPDRFARYDRDVRLEYGHVPAPLYRFGRAAVLRRFLARPRLYRTAPAAALLEAPARRNLAAAIAGLKA